MAIKKIEIGERRMSVTTGPEYVDVRYGLEVEGGRMLGGSWTVRLTNEVLNGLHKELCKASGQASGQAAGQAPLTDEQRTSLASAICAPLLVAQFQAETPESLEEAKRVDAFVNGKGFTGMSSVGGLRDMTVEIPKDRPKPQS